MTKAAMHIGNHTEPLLTHGRAARYRFGDTAIISTVACRIGCFYMRIRHARVVRT